MAGNLPLLPTIKLSLRFFIRQKACQFYQHPKCYTTLSFCRDSTTTYAKEKPAIIKMPIFFHVFRYTPTKMPLMK
jgi:hypothetical protein